MNFAPLNLLSGYSYLKSGIKLEDYLKKVKSFGYEYAALTDINSLVAMPLFTKLAKSNNIKPLTGLTLYIDNNPFVFIAKNEEGYKHLLHLLFLSAKNELSYASISEENDGLIVILSSKAKLIKSQLYEKSFARNLAKISRNIKEFYIGLDIEDKSFLVALRDFSYSHGYKVVAFPSVCYLNKEDAITLKILEAIDRKETLKEKRCKGEEYLHNYDELKEIYTEDELNESVTIASSINFEFIKKRGKMLHYHNDEGLNSDEYLTKLAFKGLATLNLNNVEYQKRLNDELSVIKEMGYSDYFLIVKDYVDYAKNNDIIVGPGRGSAVGSLVSFTLGITKCDPIKYDLIFERFLNKERQTLPDIDIDFEDDKREEVARYIERKYGKERVSKVIAIQKFGAKQALGDIGRVFNYERRDIELFTKLINKDEEKLSLRQIYKTNKKFRDLVNEDKYYLEIVSLASRIEGLPRQEGLHAAGIVINDEALNEVVPISLSSDNSYVEQFEKDYLEEQAFLKMDLLSLRNLTIVKDVLNRIKNIDNSPKNIDDIPYEDKEAIALIRSGNTMGLFQLESPGIRKAIKILKPVDFIDVAALLALYRPGPMQNIEEYSKRKQGRVKINYTSKVLEKILAPTYGIIIYQEQIMQIANKMANFSLSEADLLRRAISKKNSKALLSYQKKFVEGAINNGFKEEEAKKVYDTIYKFGDYGFNKSHALGYAMLTSKMAYLKRYYPKEFYASILNNSNSENFSSTILEIKAQKINILNPDINRSSFVYITEDNSIIFPLTMVKGISLATALELIKIRDDKPFSDLFDFVIRSQKAKITSKQIIALIDAGAFDKIEPSRASLRANIANAINYASMLMGEDGSMIIDESMFPKPTLLKCEDNIMVNLNKEYDALGLMLSTSPLKVAKEKLKKQKIINISEIKNQTGDVTIAALFKNFKNIVTKKGEPMAFASIYDDTGELEITIFPTTYEKCFSSLVKNAIVIIKGYYSAKRNEFNVTSIQKLEELINE